MASGGWSRGYLYDVVDTPAGTDDDACRPNQLFAFSLRHPVLDQARWRPVLETVRQQLLTPVLGRVTGQGSVLASADQPSDRPLAPRFGDLATRRSAPSEAAGPADQLPEGPEDEDVGAERQARHPGGADDQEHPRRAELPLEERDLAACRPFLDKALQYYPDFPEARALQEMVAGWADVGVPAGQRPAYAGPPLAMERLKPPAAGREFVLTQADGTLVFSQQGDKDAEDLAAHVTQVYRIAAATLARAGLGALRRGIVQATTETTFFRSNDRLILALTFPQDVKIGFGLLETDKMWTNSLRELGVRA